MNKRVLSLCLLLAIGQSAHAQQADSLPTATAPNTTIALAETTEAPAASLDEAEVDGEETMMDAPAMGKMGGGAMGHKCGGMGSGGMSHKGIGEGHKCGGMGNGGMGHGKMGHDKMGMGKKHQGMQGGHQCKHGDKAGHQRGGKGGGMGDMHQGMEGGHKCKHGAKGGHMMSGKGGDHGMHGGKQGHGGMSEEKGKNFKKLMARIDLLEARLAKIEVLLERMSQR